MKKVSPVTPYHPSPLSNISTEAITSFFSKFKGKAEEVTAGLADIHLDDAVPSEAVELKYMRQLVGYD